MAQEGASNEGLEKTAQWVASRFVLTKYYLGDQIKKNEIGGICDMYGGEEISIYGFGGETRGQKTA
jgi:hypothetical protein